MRRDTGRGRGEKREERERQRVREEGVEHASHTSEAYVK